jgi:hypothetical protein
MQAARKANVARCIFRLARSTSFVKCSGRYKYWKCSIIACKGANMAFFRIYLATIIIVIGIYTAIVVGNHGMYLFPIFFADIAKMEWPGQFNMDFLSFLMLGGLWLAWRHQFNAAGIALGLFIFAGGMPFLATYLLVHSYRTNGDVKALLLGEQRAAQR